MEDMSINIFPAVFAYSLPWIPVKLEGFLRIRCEKITGLHENPSGHPSLGGIIHYQVVGANDILGVLCTTSQL